MGAKSSKTKPTQPHSTNQNTEQTFIVTVEAPIEDDYANVKTGELGDSSKGTSAPASKVQEILEGKIELKKQQLDRLPDAKVRSIDTGMLDLSSSEDSDDGGDGMRKKASKKKKKKKPKPSSPMKKPTPASPSPIKPIASPIKLRLSDVKIQKKPVLSDPVQTREHFEQIQDAYALREYSVKKDGDDRNSEPPSPPKEQQPSPRSSTRFFDSWRKPMAYFSYNSTRSITMETRDDSRSSPSPSPHRDGKSSPGRTMQATPLGISQESSEADEAPIVDLDELERETFDALNAHRIRAGVQSSAAVSLKVAQSRSANPATLSSGESPTKQQTPKPFRTEKSRLRIDDTDETIMNDILSETLE